MSELIHASCVSIHGRGVLIEGPSGSGKSDLALRLIDRGAELVSDDYTLLTAEDAALVARAPENIAGKIEIRGLGIVQADFTASAPVSLIVRADPAPERLPETHFRTIGGIAVREIALTLTEASAPIKLERALEDVA